MQETMKAELINPVIAAVQDHFSEALGWSITRGRPFVKREAQPNRSVPAMVGFAGKLKGTLVVNFDPEVILAVDARIHKRPKREVDQEALDTIVEFTSGIASRIQEEQHTTYPVLFQGVSSQAKYHTSQVPLCFPLKTLAGNVVAEIIVAEQDLVEDQLADLKKIVASVGGLTADVARGIDQHNTFMQEISDELSGDASGDSASVLTAVASLIKANESMQSELNSTKQKLQDQTKQIDAFAEDARTDSLTGLANRRAFDELIQQHLASQIEKQKPTTLLMLDVDHFKRFNDRHGHLAGDEVLRSVSRVLREMVREKDIPARYGGEEFAVIFPNTTLEEAAPVAVEVRRAIYRSVVNFEEKSLRVTASAGIAQSRNGESDTEWIKRADEALYAAKNAGRNCQHWHNGLETFPLVDANGDISIGEMLAVTV